MWSSCREVKKSSSRDGFSKVMLAVGIALIGAAGTIVGAAIQTGSSKPNTGDVSVSHAPTHLLIESVSYSTDDGKVILVVSRRWHMAAGRHRHPGADAPVVVPRSRGHDRHRAASPGPGGGSRRLSA